METKEKGKDKNRKGFFWYWLLEVENFFSFGFHSTLFRNKKNCALQLKSGWGGVEISTLRIKTRHIFIFFSTYDVWKHVQYPAHVSRQPREVTQFWLLRQYCHPWCHQLLLPPDRILFLCRRVIFIYISRSHRDPTTTLIVDRCLDFIKPVSQHSNEWLNSWNIPSC